jgi:ribosomal protein S18
MADQNLNIGIKVTSDTAGAKQATTAIGGVTDAIQDQTAATNQLAAATARAKEQAQQFISDNAYGKFDDTLLKAHDAMRKATVSANGVAQATKEVGKANSQSAMGFMALSNAVQDVQYGFGGIINNIPGIVSGMGLGMGVAGAAQIAGVAFAAVAKNVDLFGTELKAASKEATEASNEADLLEASTIRLSATTAEAAKKQKELAAALKETKTEYDAIALAANQAIEAAQRFQDIETKRADLQSDLALAEVDVQLASGQIGMGDATAKRAGIRAQRDAKAAALAEKTLTATQKAEEQKAKAAEAAAKAQERILKTKLDEDRVTGMMTKEQREIATKALDAAEKGAVSAQKRLETYTREQNIRSNLRDTLASGGIPLPVSKEEAARVAQIQKTTGLVQSRLSRAQRLRGELAQDASAQDISGFKTLEAFQAERSKVSTDVISLQSQAMEARKKAGFAGENLGLARETTAVRSRIASLTQSSVAAAAAQSGYGIGFTGPIPPQGFAVDQKESEKAAREADKEAKELARETVKIVRSLAAGLKFSKEEIAGLAALVDDLRTSK